MLLVHWPGPLAVPLSVKVCAPQNEYVPVTSAVTAVLTVTTMTSVAVQPFASVTVTL